MPYSSRRSERHAINIWPGFVDALSQLVMVIIFVLLFFTAGQFFLTDALSGRDAALRKLTDQINQLTNILSLEKQQNADLQVKVTQLAAALGEANAARDALQGQVQQLTAKLQQNDSDLAASRAREQDLASQLQVEQQKSVAAESESESRGKQLSAAQTTVADLAAQIENLKAELARIGDALDAAEAKNKEQQVQLADLGQRLNQALASRVEELARYRSEFFGRLRAILGDRPDIRVVGDRFVFQSEVLFAPGSAALSPEAQQRLQPVAAALKELAPKIPGRFAVGAPGRGPHRPAADRDGAVPLELGAVDRTRAFGRALFRVAGHSGRPAVRRRVRRIPAARLGRHARGVQQEPAHRAEADRAVGRARAGPFYGARRAAFRDPRLRRGDGKSFRLSVAPDARKPRRCPRLSPFRSRDGC